MAVHVLCVRHGLSTWNAVRRWQGRADPPLTDEGRRSAAELGDALAATIGSRAGVTLWSSDLQRASSTAAIIAERLHAGPVVIDGRLRETDVGPWEGLTSVEIEAGWPGLLADRRRPEGFEPDADVLARVLPALDDIARRTPVGAVPIVVSHAGVLRAVRRHAGAVDDHLANLGGLWFAVDPDAGSISFVGLFEPPRHLPVDDGQRL
ncbi:MAG: histidine phosphatase family protein [Ilumatobacteraceae bacterium]